MKIKMTMSASNFILKKEFLGFLAEMETYANSFQLWKSFPLHIPWGNQPSLCFLFSQLFMTA